MFIKQPPTDYPRWVWEECSGGTQEVDEASSKRLYWLDVFRILTSPLSNFMVQQENLLKNCEMTSLFILF